MAHRQAKLIAKTGLARKYRRSSIPRMTLAAPDAESEERQPGPMRGIQNQRPQQKSIREATIGRYPFDERRCKVCAGVAEVKGRVRIGNIERELTSGDKKEDVRGEALIESVLSLRARMPWF